MKRDPRTTVQLTDCFPLISSRKSKSLGTWGQGLKASNLTSDKLLNLCKFPLPGKGPRLICWEGNADETQSE